jgi:hypothetical protein
VGRVLGIVGILWLFMLSPAQAQQLFVGVNSALVPRTTFPVLGVQVGGYTDDRLALRADYETNFDTHFFGAEVLYDLSALGDEWLLYLGGGATGIVERNFEGIYGLMPLPNLLGGAEYLTSSFGIFTELRVHLIYFFLPLPDLRVGVNVYF